MDLEYVLSHWASVRKGLIETIDKFHDEELDFRPFAGSRSARELMLHIAHEERGEFGLGIVQTLSEFPPEYDAQDYPSKEPIKLRLESVHTQTLKYLKTLNDDDLSRVITTPWGPRYRLIEMIGHLIEHEIHHRGELSLMLGMLGREGLNA
jgi:uncharacterized damage-inducible protein DinB